MRNPRNGGGRRGDFKELKDFREGGDDTGTPFGL